MGIEKSLILISALMCGGASMLCAMGKSEKLVKLVWTIGLVTIVIPIGLMIHYLIQRRFEWQYVYEHTSRSLPMTYRVSALWAGQEGSFMVWALILVMMGYSVVKLGYRLQAKVFGIYGMTTVALLVMTFVADPFKLTSHVMRDGLGLNQALQDPWMVVHPPLVFIGYTAMTILFAIGFTNGRDERVVKKWIRISLVFLGFGIMTGSVWAYRALGWGGYWAWDPIENIALVPWLLLCAYGHGLGKLSKVQCILPFTIAAFGTFLARSGLLQNRSAHAYASGDSRWTNLILWCFIVGAIGLVIYSVWQTHQRTKQGIKNQILVQFRVMTYIYATVILGATVLPLVLKYEVPVTFYNNMTVVYILGNSVLLVKLEQMQIKGKLVLLSIISAVLCFGVACYFDTYKIIVILTLWVVFIPLIGYILTGVGRKKSNYYWTHVCLLLMLIGGIASAGMSTHNMKNIRVSEIETIVKEGKTTILHKPLEDEIIEQIIPSREVQQVTVTYTSKPLIGLFWLGSFGILGIMIIRKHHSN